MAPHEERAGALDENDIGNAEVDEVRDVPGGGDEKDDGCKSAAAVNVAQVMNGDASMQYVENDGEEAEMEEAHVTGTTALMTHEGGVAMTGSKMESAWSAETSRDRHTGIHAVF